MRIVPEEAASAPREAWMDVVPREGDFIVLPDDDEPLRVDSVVWYPYGDGQRALPIPTAYLVLKPTRTDRIKAERSLMP